jgi:hypothetical protein
MPPGAMTVGCPTMVGWLTIVGVGVMPGPYGIIRGAGGMNSPLGIGTGLPDPGIGAGTGVTGVGALSSGTLGSCVNVIVSSTMLPRATKLAGTTAPGAAGIGKGAGAAIGRGTAWNSRSWPNATGP